MKTLRYIEEDNAGNVTGAIVADDKGNESVVDLVGPFPRAELASKARELAALHGIALPSNPAIPPADAAPQPNQAPQ